MSKSYQPPSVTVFPWLRANLGKGALAPLTSCDTKALRAAVELVELYCYSGDEYLLPAFHAVVSLMQPHCRQFAYHAIAHVMDWHNRLEIWEKADLPMPEPLRNCEHEPKQRFVSNVPL